MTHTETIEGDVEAVNDRGVRVRGEWLNFSKFRAVEPPKAGDHVRLSIDTKGFIMDLERIDGDELVDERFGGVTSETATRLAVLEAAARFAADRDEIKSADVLRIADVWLEWVGR